MFKRILGYILSKGSEPTIQLTKREELAALHKMKEPDHLKIAILTCEIAIETATAELRVRERIKLKLTQRATAIEDVITSLLLIQKSAAAPTTKIDKKYFMPPTWIFNSFTQVSADDYFIYQGTRCQIVPKLKTTLELLKEIDNLTKLDFNAKFVDYYVDKGQKVYIEVAKVAANFI